MQSHFLSCTSAPASGTATIALIISLVTFLWNVYNYFRSRAVSSYDALDKTLSDLIRDTISRPCFRDPIWIERQLSKTEQDDDSRIYAAHAAMCLNAVETAVSKYGRKVMKTHFGPAMRTLLLRHKEWYIQQQASYRDLAPLYEAIAEQDAPRNGA